jgi:NADPH:quinone reductase
MQAIRVHAHGGPEVLRLEEVPMPEPGPTEVRVKLEAIGINFMDVYNRTGAYRAPLPSIPGAEGAGVVDAIGSSVTGLLRGDRVASAQVPGACAQYAVVPADRLVLIPDKVDTRTAAAVMLQGMTAHYLTQSTYPVAPGDPVVVHAAAGGVGLLLTQMVKLRGGVVIATTSTDAKAELARAAGADHVTRYEGLGEVVREVTAGAGAAVVYDGVGRSTFDDSLDALRPRGYMVLYGAASGPVPPLDLLRLAPKSLFVTRPTLGAYMVTRDELLGRAHDLFDWIEQGRLEVRIGGAYPLAEAARAHADLQARRTTGKLLLLPG